MLMKNMTLLTVMMIFIALLIAGCGTNNADTPTDNTPATDTHSTDNTQDTGNTQIANPASVYCEEQGGTLSIVDDEAGQRGICTLADGTVCDEWAYFRNECPTGSGTAPVACTEEAKQCLDGSYVGREGPNCEFAPCK